MSLSQLVLSELEVIEKVAADIARQAGKLITKTCGNVKEVETKQSFADLVTETDKNVEQYVFKQLKNHYPEHKFIGEESVAEDNHGKVSLTDEPTWIVDPVDVVHLASLCNHHTRPLGTMNFVHTFPYVAVCIGLAVNKVPVLGVVYCPAKEQLFTARRGNGAYLNGLRINVRCSSSLRDSLVSAELGSDRSEAKRDCVFQNLQSISWQCHGIRSLGSAAMNICAVAQGHFNAYYEFGLHCWDMCAPVVILLEAGGFVCDTTGAAAGDKFNLLNRRLIAACSEKIALELSQAMTSQLELPCD